MNWSWIYTLYSMNWSMIFRATTYLAVAIIVISIILRFFIKFKLYIPIMIALLLLVSAGGTYAVRIAEMTDAEAAAYFDIDEDEVGGTIRAPNNLLLYGSMLTVLIVYASCICEGVSRCIRYLYRKLYRRRMRN